MTSVYGSKVKEPRVFRKSTLPVDDRNSFTTDLAIAWSKFGEAKSVLHRLESKTVSPPTKAAGLKKHHSDPVVTFVTPTHPSPPRTSVSTGHVTSRVPGILKSSSSRENKKESVYVVEPPVLNVTSREDTKCAQEADTQTQHGGTVGVQRSPSSNPTAVFGPPVAFEGSRSTDTKQTPHSKSTLRSMSDSVTTKYFPISSSSYSSTTLSSNPKHPSTEEVPIRKFELHPEVARALTSKVEQQKLALRNKAPSSTTNGTLSRNYNPIGYQTQSHTINNTVAKKRKVTTVPPPRTYAGFSWGANKHSTGTPSTAAQSRPSVERMSTVREKLSTATKGPVARESSKKLGPGDRVRKVHRMTTPDTATKPPGIITTSSWKTGKQLADRILREQQNNLRDKSPSLTESSFSSVISSVEPSSSSLSQKKSGASLDDPLSTWTKEPSKRKLDDILIDLELSGDEGRQEDPKRAQTTETKEKTVGKKPRFTSEQTYPTEKVRHYNQTEVQAYMRRQKEERRRKAQEQREEGARASTERQKRLQELYDTQRQRVEVNLRRKQKKREEYAQSLATGVHIHIHEPSSSVSEEGSLPTVTIRPAPRTTQYSPKHTDTRRTASYLHTSPPSHLHSSPPSHPQPSPPSHLHGSPPSQPQPFPSSYLHPSPSHSPYRDIRARSSNSPVRVQQSCSPHVYAYQHTTSPGRVPTEHAQYSPGLYHSSPSSGGADAHSGTTHSYMPSPPKSPRTYDERLQAIRASALRLKQKIANESQRALNESYSSSKSPEQLSTSYLFSEQPRYHHQANQEGRSPGADLPGVHNVQEHALLAEQYKKETEAALKIQAAYRGHTVRKSLKWGQPSTQTDQVSGRSPYSTQVSTSSQPITVTRVTPPVSVSVTDSHSMSVINTQSLFPRPPPPAVTNKMEPWKQGGGDNHSVINVFTRQHERLRESLSLLSDQKRDEIRSLSSGSHNSPPNSVQTRIQPTVAQTHSQTLSGQESSPKPSIASEQSSGTYTQVFDPEPSKEDVVSLHSGSTVSFSDDSLYSHSSAPRSQPSGSATPTTNHTPPHLEAAQSPSSTHSLAKTLTPPSITKTPPKESVPMFTIDKEDMPAAITPPGSSSFVESFSSTTPHPPQIHVPPVSATYSKALGGRLSPRSLELQHLAQLNHYETIEENLHHLSQVERARELSAAQQETVVLAQQLKAQEQTHKSDLSALASKAKLEIETMKKQLEAESSYTSERYRELQEKANLQAKEHARRLQEMQLESERAAHEATLKLNESRSAATSAVIEAAQQQIQAAHTMAVSVATAATKEAVKEALKKEMVNGSPAKTEYESDFESSVVHSKTLKGSVDENASVHKSDQTSVQESGQTSAQESQGGSKDNTLTPEEDPTMLLDGGHSVSPQEVPEDIDEGSIQELLHSESDRLRQSRQPAPLSDTEVSPLQVKGSQPLTRESSPFSPAGEDSFMFTSRMVSEYVKEEELRARHRAALLELREKALQEKTDAQLKWLELQRRDLRSKGADDLMPPLKKKEEGVRRGFRKEQAEIRRLKKAQEAAAHERKLMLREQKEISKMRKTTQFYRDKIRSYRSRSYASPSPVPSADESISSYYSRSMTPDHSVLTDLSGVDELRDKSGTPSEHLESESFPTYSPSTAREVSTQQEVTTGGDEHKVSSPQSDGSVSEHLEKTLTSNRSARLSSSAKSLSPARTPSSPRPTSVTSSGKRKSVSPLAGRKEKSVTLKHMRKLASADAEKYLAQRELSLQKRRQAVEEAIAKHRELLKRDRELDREEESVDKLVDEAMEMLRQIPLSSARDHHFPKLSLLDPTLSSTATRLSKHRSTVSKMTHSVAEELSGSESIAEELSGSVGAKFGGGSAGILSEYAGDTFESLDSTLTPSHRPHPVTTSTPEHEADLSLDDSVAATESAPDSLVTTTSSGSALEARIRALKQQLRQRQEEVKRVQNEQRRKKKTILKQQEEQLRKRLEAVNQKASIISQQSPPHLNLSPDPETPSSLSGPESRDLSPPLSEQLSQTAPSREPSPPSPHKGSSSHEQSPSSQAPSREHSVSIGDEASDEDYRSPQPVESEYTSREVTASPQVHTPQEGSASPVSEDISKSLPSDLHVPDKSTPQKEDQSELCSYTPFMASEENSKNLTLTPHSVDNEHTQLDDESQGAPVGLESNKIASVETFIPPPQLDETPSTVQSVITEQISEQVDQLQAGTDDHLSENEQIENVREDDYADDFEPEAEYTEELLATKSDISLSVSISGSRGGDSEEETSFQVGQRVIVGGVMEGTVRFIGKTHFAPGVWIGVEFNEPCGRNDGSIGEHRYFDCPENHGLFAPPRKVTTIDELAEMEGSEGSPQESSIGEMVQSEGDASMSEYSDDRSEGNQEDCTGDLKQLSIKQDNRALDARVIEQITLPDEIHSPSFLASTSDKITKQISELTQDSLSEQQAPGEFELVGEKPDSHPSAPEVLAQHLQPATPTPAPPPEFAEGASREGSTEPPALPTTLEHVQQDRRQEMLSDELAQELMNEAYETMHQIWKSKRSTEPEPKSVEVVQVPKDKEVPLSLDEKADKITDQLLSLLLQSESSLMSNIRSSKNVSQIDDKTEPAQTEPTTPTKSQLQIPIDTMREFSPPPLSPPSPYRPLPDNSPPGSPPFHFPQNSAAARVVARENSPPLQHELSSPPVKLERASSTESIVQLLDNIKVTTAQCMVPSERQQINEMVKQAWEVAAGVGFEKIHCQELNCPENILNLFTDVRELSPEEKHCHRAYIQLVFGLTIQVIKQLHPPPQETSVWLCEAVIRKPVVTVPPSLEVVQTRVYAALIRGQLPTELPNVKFLHGKKRPGGKEVDFVDSVLIKELRFEEPKWIDYHEDEITVKIETADSILDSLLSEAVQIMCEIEHKQKKQ